MVDKGGWEVYVYEGGEGRGRGGGKGKKKQTGRRCVSACLCLCSVGGVSERGGEWSLMNNNNDNVCLFPFFPRYYFPSSLLDRSRTCSQD